MKASNLTAVIAGLWAGLGLSAADRRCAGLSASWRDVLWFVQALVFIFVPAVYLVVGRDAGRFGARWLADPAERARYGRLATRVLVWLLAAGAARLLWTMAIGASTG